MTTTTVPLLAVEEVDLETLRPDPANPRRIEASELDALERSIREWGFVQPVLARRTDRVVIGGHQRLVAARRLGLASVPVMWLDVSVEEARLLGLALNKISGAWDEPLLARLLADLQAASSVDLTLSGFGAGEVKDLLRSLESRELRERPEDFDLDEALDAARRRVRAKPGELWSLGEHRRRVGDATKAGDLERVLGGRRAGMTFVDPPTTPGSATMAVSSVMPGAAGASPTTPSSRRPGWRSSMPGPAISSPPPMARCTSA
ncbi:MAG: ParB N-terminal domain-containing protein [Candidatus Limnocylindrales bacterium]